MPHYFQMLIIQASPIEAVRDRIAALLGLELKRGNPCTEATIS